MREYEVLCSSSDEGGLEELEKKVTKALENEWQLAGGVAVNTLKVESGEVYVVYSQAVTRLSYYRRPSLR